MKYRFTRITIPVLLGIVFGFFYGCSSNSNLAGTGDSVPGSELTKEEVQEELTGTRKQLGSSPADPDLYYRKGYLLSELAGMTDPFERNPLYSEMRQALERANTFYTESSAGKDDVDELLKVSWSNEHNQGVQIIQIDSTLKSEDYYRAAVHFNNATTILPDSSISYKLEARAYYRNHQRQKAIATLEKARDTIENLPADMLEQLAFLYLENNEPGKAVGIYEEAEAFSGDNLNLIHGLANAYISAGEHQKAIELLENLASNNPDNILYAQSLGTEFYFLGTEQLNLLQRTGAENTSRIDAVLGRADSLYAQAGRHLKKARELNPGNTDITNSLSEFYRNAAANLQKAGQAVPESRKPEVEKRVREYLNRSIPLLITLTEQQPDNSKYWEALYRVYSYLGMSDKARQAKEKAGGQ